LVPFLVMGQNTINESLQAPGATTIIDLNIFLEKKATTLGHWSEYMLLAKMFNMELDSNLSNEMRAINRKIDFGNEMTRNRKPITGLNKKQIEDYLKWLGDFITSRIKSFKGECSGAYWYAAKEIYDRSSFTIVYALPDSAMLNMAINNKLVERNKKCICELTSESLHLLNEEQTKMCCFRGYAIYIFDEQ
jgi:hypothetical protein